MALVHTATTGGVAMAQILILNCKHMKTAHTEKEKDRSDLTEMFKIIHGNKNINSGCAVAVNSTHGQLDTGVNSIHNQLEKSKYSAI